MKSTARPLIVLLLARTAAAALALLPWSPARSATVANLCRNPGFELLNPAGNNFPLDWSAVKSPAGQSTVDHAPKAHGGQIALRLAANAAGQSGANGEPIPIRRGEIEFHYQALESGNGGENLVLYVIALGADGAEVPGRTAFKVPAAHVGDGQWHAQKLEFDYTANPAVTGILIAPRVNEATSPAEGAWLVDDFVCVESALGPRGHIEAFHLADPVLVVGQPSLLVAQVANTGDEPLPASVLKLDLPPDIAAEAAEPTETPIPELAPREWRRLTWRVAAAAPAQARLNLDWHCGDAVIRQTRPVWCVQRRDPRAECTDSDGFWRPMPALGSLQEGNSTPLRPLEPIKSAQLPDSFIGVTAHLPRSRDFERIFEPEHLVDGDPQTSWSGRGYATTVPGPVDWAEVWWTSHQLVREIRLVPYHRAEGFPVDFQVKLRTGETWTLAHEARGVVLAAAAGTSPKQPYVIALSSSLAADAVRIEATRFQLAAAFFTDCATSHFLRLSEIEVISAAGDNVALATRGGRAEVAFTFRSFFNSPAVIRKTYPEMDLGALDIAAGRQAWRSKEELGFQTYPEMLAFLRQRFAPYRTDFEIWANEWNAVPTRELSPYRGNSEIVEAKQAARFFLVNILCGVRAVWWSLVNENTGFDWGILRTGDLSRKPVYYTIQALTTLLSGARSDVGIAATAAEAAPELRCEPLRGRDGEILVALWSAVPPQDDTVARPVTLRVRLAPGRRVKAEAVDTLRAQVQRLCVEQDGPDLVIRGLLVIDCPLIVRIET